MLAQKRLTPYKYFRPSDMTEVKVKKAVIGRIYRFCQY
jgi:hypothetical protein